MTDNLPALLPCPFCGGAPKTLERPDNIDGTEFVYAVSCCCDGYSARAHQLARCKTPEQVKATATSAWNRRAAIAQAQSLPDGVDIEDLKDRLVAISSAVADDDDRAAQAILRTTLELLAASPQPQPVQPSETDNGISSEDWIEAAMRVYLIAGDTEQEAQECAEYQWGEMDMDDLCDPYEAAMADVEGRGPALQPQPVQPSDPWLPIETAPKNGTEIIMSNGKDVSAGSWFKGHDGTYDRDGAPNCDEKDACWMDWSGGMLPEPTHWMPLPPAPQPKD